MEELGEQTLLGDWAANENDWFCMSFVMVVALMGGELTVPVGESEPVSDRAELT